MSTETPAVDESAAIRWADALYLTAREAAEEAREGDEPLSLMVGLIATMDVLLDAGLLPAVVPARIASGDPLSGPDDPCPTCWHEWQWHGEKSGCLRPLTAGTENVCACFTPNPRLTEVDRG